MGAQEVEKLVPASPPVPTSTKKEQHYYDDEECRGVHVVLPLEGGYHRLSRGALIWERGARNNTFPSRVESVPVDLLSPGPPGNQSSPEAE